MAPAAHLFLMFLLGFSRQLAVEASRQGNLALGAKTMQSTTAYYGDSKKAVDGNLNTNYYHYSCTHTTAEKNPWWRVDLGQACRITTVAITNRGDCCAERLNGAQIRIGNSLENNGNNNLLVATIQHIPQGETKKYEVSQSVGRYINILLPGNDKYLTLCEVQVFGDKIIPGNLAFEAKTIQSTTIYNGYSKLAVDNNLDTNYHHYSCTHTIAEKNPWWRVDLGQDYSITSVVITNRGDCCADRLNGAQIRIGNSLENNGNNNLLVATIQYIPKGQTRKYEVSKRVGRYINILVPGNYKYLTLCEVQVFGDKVISSGKLDNLALGAKAIQSTTWNKGFANLAVDGNLDTDNNHNSCTHTALEKNPWWRVDLRRAYRITSVAITNRGDCCAERLNGAQIHIGNSLENNGNNNLLVATIYDIPEGKTKTFKVDGAVGRYVNIFLLGKGKYLTLCEVQVFGYQDDE